MIALHPTSQRLLDSFAADPRGSLLVTGPAGSGRTTSLDYLIQQTLGREHRPGEVLFLTDKNIDGLRQLLKQLSLTRHNPKKPRLAVIDKVDQLVVAAQSILLKTLEEPPAKSHFVLTAESAQSLPPTIVSRCQLVRLRRPAKADLFKLFPAKTKLELELAHLIADGWPGDFCQLASDQNSDLQQQVKLAKDYLGLDKQGRAIYLTNKANLETIDQLLAGLIRLAQAALRTAAAQDKLEVCQSWQKRLERLLWLDEFFSATSSQRALALGLTSIF